MECFYRFTMKASQSPVHTHTYTPIAASARHATTPRQPGDRGAVLPSVYYWHQGESGGLNEQGILESSLTPTHFKHSLRVCAGESSTLKQCYEGELWGISLYVSASTSTVLLPCLRMSWNSGTSFPSWSSIVLAFSLTLDEAITLSCQVCRLLHGFHDLWQLWLN